MGGSITPLPDNWLLGSVQSLMNATFLEILPLLDHCPNSPLYPFIQLSTLPPVESSEPLVMHDDEGDNNDSSVH